MTDQAKTPPPNWGKDSITDFFDWARNNEFSTFHNMKKMFSRLILINNLFSEARDYMANSKDWFPLLLFLKSHSAFLAAARLASSGQMAETFMVLRGALESALYGFYIFKNSNYAEIWIKRHESDESLNKMKETFSIGKTLNELGKTKQPLEKIVRSLYERTIDYGAHPNPNSLLTILQHNSKTKEKTTTDEFKVEYLTGNQLTIALCLKTTAQVGIACLKILQLVMSERFKLTTLDIKVTKASRGL
jgi:hypothetical protein